MGKKTEALRSALQQALETWQDRVNAMNDAYADVQKNNQELGKIVWEKDKDADWLKRKIKCDKEGETNWAVYNQAKAAAEKAQGEAEAAQRDFSVFMNKKKDDGKVIHAIKSKLNKLKAILKD